MSYEDEKDRHVSTCRARYQFRFLGKLSHTLKYMDWIFFLDTENLLEAILWI